MIQQNHTFEKLNFSEKSGFSFKLSKFSLLAHVYFFCNSLLLPKGLLYTNVLSPFFYWQVIKKKLNTFWRPFFSFLIFYDAIHLYFGVDISSFLLSNGLFISTYFCVVAFYHFFNTHQDLQKIFKQILIVNLVLSLLAIPFLFMDLEYQVWFWWINILTKGITEFPRLKLCTYEASYYSLLMIPIVFYYLFKAIFNQFTINRNLTLFIVLFPMILSLSFGVIGATILTALILCIYFSKRLLRYKRPFFITIFVFALSILSFFILINFFPTNPITVRFYNILAGVDTSANGRIYDSLTMAWRIANIKNLYFGAGLGQIKIQAEEVVKVYYNYWGYLPRYDIPNTMGETLAIFGILGVFIRLSLEWYLFFKTKVSQNYYRLALFVFIFIYQFTGSYITNIVEYVIWILAFSQVFKQFNVKPLIK